MIIKYEVRPIAPTFTAEPQTFGEVADKEALIGCLVECIREQVEAEVIINGADIEAFYALMEANGNIVGTD